MPAAYSLDLRKRVLHDCDHGMSSEDAARKNINPVPNEISPLYEQEVRQLVAKHPDATLVELHAMLPNNIDETGRKRT